MPIELLHNYKRECGCIMAVYEIDINKAYMCFTEIETITEKYCEQHKPIIENGEYIKNNHYMGTHRINRKL